MMMRRSKGSTTSKELPTNYNRLRHARLSPHPHIMGKAAGTALNGAASSTHPLQRDSTRRQNSPSEWPSPRRMSPKQVLQYIREDQKAFSLNCLDATILPNKLFNVATEPSPNQGTSLQKRSLGYMSTCTKFAGPLPISSSRILGFS